MSAQNSNSSPGRNGSGPLEENNRLLGGLSSTWNRAGSADGDYQPDRKASTQELRHLPNAGFRTYDERKQIIEPTIYDV